MFCTETLRCSSHARSWATYAPNARTPLDASAHRVVQLGLADERVDQRTGLPGQQPLVVGHGFKLVPPVLLQHSLQRRRGESSGTQGTRQASHIHCHFRGDRSSTLSTSSRAVLLLWKPSTERWPVEGPFYGPCGRSRGSGKARRGWKSRRKPGHQPPEGRTRI